MRCLQKIGKPETQIPTSLTSYPATTIESVTNNVSIKKVPMSTSESSITEAEQQKIQKSVDKTLTTVRTECFSIIRNHLV